MKNIILIISIGLNVALGLHYWVGSKRTLVPSVESVLEKNSKPQKRAEKTETPSPAAPSKVAVALDWRSVESADYKEYISNLRAIGCPEKTIRDIIRADVNELYRQKAKAAGPAKKFEYWKPGNPMAGLFDEEQMARDQDLAKEKRELLKTLLGGDFLEETDMASRQVVDPMQRMMDFLSPDKQAAMTELEQKFAGKLMKTVKDASRGDTSAMQKLLAEKDAEMLKILSPEEKFEYDLRLSQTAMMMRMGMGDFEPTEQEFREMFRAQKQFETEHGMTGFGTRGGIASAERQELNNQLKSVLGEDRFRTYQFEQRWAFDPLHNIARDHNVPKETAFKVFDLQTAAETEAAKIRANQNFSDEQRKAAMDAVRAETKNAVGQVIGAPATEDYIKKAGWFKNLK